MTFDENFWQALADYGVQFETPDSLGAGSPPAAWLKEYERIRADAFSASLATGASTEGGSVTGIRQFPQATLLDALHCRRFELNPAYVLPVHLLSFASERAMRAHGRRGWLMTFKPAS